MFLMAEIYKFFDSTEDDLRYYQASDFANYFGKVLSTGLLHIDEVPGLEVSGTGSDLNLYVSPGGAIMKGHLYENTTPKKLEVGLPESSLDRIDRVVLRFDNRYESRYIRLFVKQGESSVNPLAPTLQRDNEIYELSLASIRVRSNTSSISLSDIKDERLDRQFAGLTFSLISKPHLADIATGSYSATAVMDGQTDFVVPLESFNKDGDGLTVFVNGAKAPNSSYKVLHPRTVRFNTGKPYGTLVEFEVIRGVILMPDDYVLSADEVKVLDSGGYFLETNVEGVLQKIARDLNNSRKEVANLNLQMDASKRVTNGHTFGTDWSNTFGMNLDRTRTIVRNSVSVGQTNIEAMSSTGFLVGQKVSIFDRTQSEEVTITNITSNNITISPTRFAYVGGVNIARSNVDSSGYFGTLDTLEESFETGVGGWVYTQTNNSGYNITSGGVSTAWKSDGAYSYLLKAEQDTLLNQQVWSGSARITKSLDLTNADFLLFDANIIGRRLDSEVSRLLIGGVVVWSVGSGAGEYKNIRIDVRSMIGVKTVTFEASMSSSSNLPKSASFYIDNIRLSYPLLTTDIRFTTYPSEGVVVWAERDSQLTIEAELNGVSMKNATSAYEDQFVGQKTFGSSEVRLKLNRRSTGENVRITKILGGAG